MFKKYIYLKSAARKNPFKKTFGIFLIGIIFGVFLSQFTLTSPGQIITSPVAFSLAQTKDLVLPVSEGEILGEFDVKPQGGGFGKILVQEIKEKVATVSSISVLTEKPKEDKVISSKEGQLTIAFLGDSMIDTMGQGLPYIDSELEKYYPNYKFHLLNYGTGATDIEYGLQRLTQDYEYLGNKITALVGTDPDIVVIESFAYNPWGEQQSDLDHHWLAMAKIVDVLKSRTRAKIIFLATIAPNKANFGQGPAGVNWNKDTAYLHAQKIEKYLDNTIRFAKSQGYAYIDAYTPSIVSGDGNLTYINAGDHIHPSVAGCNFIASLVVGKLNVLGWIL